MIKISTYYLRYGAQINSVATEQGFLFTYSNHNPITGSFACGSTIINLCLHKMSSSAFCWTEQWTVISPDKPGMSQGHVAQHIRATVIPLLFFERLLNTKQMNLCCRGFFSFEGWFVKTFLHTNTTYRLSWRSPRAFKGRKVSASCGSRRAESILREQLSTRARTSFRPSPAIRPNGCLLSDVGEGSCVCLPSSFLPFAGRLHGFSGASRLLVAGGQHRGRGRRAEQSREQRRSSQECTLAVRSRIPAVRLRGPETICCFSND